MKLFLGSFRALLLLPVMLLSGIMSLHASHIAAGEITTTRDVSNPLRFTMILTLYTDVRATNSGGTVVKQESSILYFGDGASQESPVLLRVDVGIAKKIQKNTYKFDHTYAAPGTYTMYFVGDNRNKSVLNIEGSDQNNFYIETRVVVDPLMAFNSSPKLLHPPVDDGAVGRVYLHNPAAFDADGDSIGYKLLASRQSVNGEVVECTRYRFPDIESGGTMADGTGTAFCNISIDGTLTWNAPAKAGLFNVAILLTEYRKIKGRNVIIGFVVRDMQIEISDTKNHPPKLRVPKDTCLMAGESIRSIISAIDPDTDRITLTAAGGIFAPDGKAVFTPGSNVPDPRDSLKVKGVFTWAATCADIRSRAYDVQFDATDIPKQLPALTDLAGWRITVKGPAPVGLAAKAINGGITLNWTPYNTGPCTNADSMYIWRRIDSVHFKPSGCDCGDPEALGYTRIGRTKATISTFRDTFDLHRGNLYSYRLTASFKLPKGGKSCLSAQDTAFLLLDAPVFCKVSVINTDSAQGKVRVWFTRPLQADTVAFPKPYTYKLYRSINRDVPSAEDASNLKTGDVGRVLIRTGNLASDTAVVDTAVKTNTGNQPEYSLTFFASTGDSLDSDPASTVSLHAQGFPTTVTLNWKRDAPWNNGGLKNYIYRAFGTEPNREFRLIDSVTAGPKGGSYTDEGGPDRPLRPNREYWYFVTARGKYGNSRLQFSILDSSQIASAVVPDTIAPCEPGSDGDLPGLDLTPCYSCEVLRDGGNIINTLTWHPNHVSACDSDVITYRVYYAEHDDDTLKAIATLASSDTVFRHSNKGSLAGCYQVTAIDRSGNESPKSQRVCKDNCTFYDLPNVITPNDDEYNQYFRPRCSIPGFVRSAAVRIYNRWGYLVYSGDADPNINWDGRDLTGLPLPAGIYWYIADIQTIRLRRADEPLHRSGMINIRR
ncbi:MAG: gliding motility-associated C-terminal domain-containing protein [Bacteroidota bacterium]